MLSDGFRGGESEAGEIKPKRRKQKGDDDEEEAEGGEMSMAKRQSRASIARHSMAQNVRSRYVSPRLTITLHVALPFPSSFPLLHSASSAAGMARIHVWLRLLLWHYFSHTELARPESPLENG
jgi:hypothetical protein